MQILSVRPGCPNRQITFYLMEILNTYLSINEPRLCKSYNITLNCTSVLGSIINRIEISAKMIYSCAIYASRQYNMSEDLHYTNGPSNLMNGCPLCTVVSLSPYQLGMWHNDVMYSLSYMLMIALGRPSGDYPTYQMPFNQTFNMLRNTAFPGDSGYYYAIRLSSTYLFMLLFLYRKYDHTYFR